MNKLNFCLSKESEEKSQSNEQVDSLKEQLYLNQVFKIKCFIFNNQ